MRILPALLVHGAGERMNQPATCGWLPNTYLPGYYYYFLCYDYFLYCY